jgi:hypothetical protein
VETVTFRGLPRPDRCCLMKHYVVMATYFDLQFSFFHRKGGLKTKVRHSSLIMTSVGNLRLNLIPVLNLFSFTQDFHPVIHEFFISVYY